MLTRAALAIAALTATAQAESIELGAPIDCKFGKDCWVQQYFDHDPGPEAKDYACGGEVYDAHDGTDIRIRDTAERGVKVIASAPGVVRAVRDDMEDALVRSKNDVARVTDRECGNGVVINHADGWQTQYCHMRQGTIAVKAGDQVQRGTPLGDVGYSGMAAFPHVHLTVRNNGAAVDPFRTNGDGSQCGDDSKTLWSADAKNALAYRRGDIIDMGFTPEPVDMAALEESRLLKPAATRTWPAIVAYVWSINLQKDDEITISVTGPDNMKAENRDRLDRNKAQYMLFAGQKQPAGAWPEGEYIARAVVKRDGEIALEKEVRMRID